METPLTCVSVLFKTYNVFCNERKMERLRGKEKGKSMRIIPVPKTFQPAGRTGNCKTPGRMLEVIRPEGHVSGIYPTVSPSPLVS